MGSSRRKLTPEFEHDLNRDPRLGYEAPNGLAVRSLVIQFREEPLRDGMRAIKELEETRPLLERARHGIEFFGLSDSVTDRFHRIKGSHGLERFAEFASLLCLLRRCEDYRLLSVNPTIGLGPGAASAAINAIVEFVNENFAETMAIADVAARFNMSESRFSRYFSKATDSTFTAFVNLVRVHKACELLMHSEDQVSTICYAVGFSNVANFNRRFREVKGMTPREFRRQGTQRLGSGIMPGGTSRP